MEKMKELEAENAALEEERRQIESQLVDLRALVEKDTDQGGALAVNSPEDTSPSEEGSTEYESSTAGSELEIVDNTDQFGRIISKYKYGYDGSGNKYTDSYSIYYYADSGELYKVADYDGANQLTSYYLIVYDENEQIKIKKYDANNNLMYVK